MVDYIGTIVGRNNLGVAGQLQYVTARFTFAAATLAVNPTDTYVMPNLFSQNGAAVPVEVVGLTIASSTTTPASLVVTVGNSDSANAFMRTKAMTETGQLVRIGDGASIGGARITNPTATMTVTTAATAAFTGDLDFTFAVRRCID